jgi:hypothetical protein
VEAHFQASAQGLASGSGDYGLRGEAQGHQEVLEGLDALFDLIWVSVLDGVGHLTEVGSDGEVAALIADD